ncbi:MAG: DUF6460 domain-containing protein, partial [Hyphomicrobiaceae bacterium]
MNGGGFFGGNPIGVILRLIVLSIIVGVVMSALGIYPADIIYHLRYLIDRLSHLSFGFFENAFGYFMIGAVVVIPIWII